MKAESDRRISRYAEHQCASRLDRLAFEINNAGRSPGPDPVHDIRVAIRRFSACLRVFSDFFPKKASKTIQRELRAVMKLAGKVRDRDIAIELGQKAGLNSTEGVLVRWSEERKEAATELVRVLQQLSRSGASLKWRARLGV